MSSQQQHNFLFTEVAANPSRREKELSDARIRSHVAKESHRNRKRLRARPLAGRCDHANWSWQRSLKAKRDFFSPVLSDQSHETPQHDRRALIHVPYNPYPIEKTAAVQMAMQYYTEVYARSKSLQMGCQMECSERLQKVLPCALQDPVWFSASVASCLNVWQRGLPESHAMNIASLDYQRRATAELRRRISTVDGYATDGTLMAIGHLIALTILQGDMTAVKSHVTGIKLLIKQRPGGEASLDAFDGYLRERIYGQFVMWDFTQAALKIGLGPTDYPTHPFPPGLCQIVTKLPPGLEQLALSGSINLATIRLLGGIVSYSSRILASGGDRAGDIRKMLILAYALSRLTRNANLALNALEHILIMVLLEVCVQLGSTRNAHWVILAFQQLRLYSVPTTAVQEVLMNSCTYQNAYIWMGLVLLATSTMDSDTWRLGKDLVEAKGSKLEWEDMIELCGQYIWCDELSVRLAQNFQPGKAMKSRNLQTSNSCCRN